MKTSRSLFFAIVIISMYVFSPNAFGQKKKKDKELDGKVFLVELTEEGGKKKSISDELSFKSDKFKSKTMGEKNKFDAALYIAVVDSSSGEKILNFETETKNDSDELITWKGTVNNEEIEGKAVWTKKGKVKKEYSFSGSLKLKK